VEAATSAATARCQGKHCRKVELVRKRSRYADRQRRHVREWKREGGSINRLQKERASAH